MEPAPLHAKAPVFSPAKVLHRLLLFDFSCCVTLPPPSFPFPQVIGGRRSNENGTRCLFPSSSVLWTVEVHWREGKEEDYCFGHLRLHPPPFLGQCPDYDWQVKLSLYVRLTAFFLSVVNSRPCNWKCCCCCCSRWDSFSISESMNDIFRYHPYTTKSLDTDEVFTRAKVQPDGPSNFAQKVRKKYLTFVANSQFRPFLPPK